MVSACSTIPSLMPTPAFYQKESFKESQVPYHLRVPESEILYITDRAIKKQSVTSANTDKVMIKYGSRRSPSIAYGNAVVKFRNKNIDWNALISASSLVKRKKSFQYKFDSVDEVGRFPASPYQFVRTGKRIDIAPKVASLRDGEIKKFHQLLGDRLDKAHQKDVILFVHGFNNTFEQAAFTLAGLWHFLERQAVPIIYSWPAAKGGLTGYFTDRESGEFTVFHLKETLRILSGMPEVDNIHIIAHSRGTDVTTTALRELVIESRAAGIDPRDSLKVKNLILAAPDLDFGVMQQRLMAEHFGPAIGQITIYTSLQDKALRLSQLIMSGLRFGRVRAEDVDSNERKIFATAGNVNFIQVPKSNRFIGHNYFHSNPAVSADLLRLIKINAKPGSKERDLESLGDNFWKIKKRKK